MLRDDIRRALSLRIQTTSKLLKRAGLKRMRASPSVRCAANRAEWFNQVNKPLDIYDIFGGPEVGCQTGDRLGPRS
jgi:hypothetical protein